MKDRRVFVALLVLVVLVGFLVYVTLQKKAEDSKRDVKIDSLSSTIQSLNRKLTELQSIKPIDGKTPQKGVDYNDGVAGKNGVSIVGPRGANGSNGLSAYEIAIKNGFNGTEQQWLDSLKAKGDKGDNARDIDITCIAGLVMKQYAGDTFWQPTNIRCEVGL